MRSPVSMQRRFRAGTLVALVGLTAVACEPGSSTTPTTPTTPTAPTPLPLAASLAGTWTGTANVIWHELDGGGGCSGPVTVTFAQSGSVVSAMLPAVSDCINESLRFEGTLSGNGLVGNIVFPTFNWPITGRASEDHVTFEP